MAVANGDGARVAALPNSALGLFLADIVAGPVRLFFRYGPGELGKLWVWDHVVRPYVTWRPIRKKAVTESGLRLSGELTDTIHSAVYFFGVWEPALTDYISEQLAEGDVFIDIGANVGVHAMHAAQRVGRSGRVHAIEASPTICAILRRNVAANGLDNVVIHNIAVTDRTETITVLLHDQTNLGGTSMLRGDAEGSVPHVARETVDARPLPDIVPMDDLRRAKIIKIDVEGAEWLVLQGFAPVMPELRHDVSIVMEVNRSALVDHGHSVKELLDFFDSRGYHAMRMPQHSAATCIRRAPPKFLPLTDDFEVADLVLRRTMKA